MLTPRHAHTYLYSLSTIDVSNFLVSAFGDEEYIVGVYEDRAPHLMIGVNTGTGLVGNFLIKDNSQRCSEEQISKDECTLVHLNIENYVSSEEDMILRKGHREFQQIGFGNADSVVTFWKSEASQEQSRRRIQEKEEDEKEGDSAYLATSLIYEQENANVKWRIMVVVPLLIQTEDSITSDEGKWIMSQTETQQFVSYLICLLFRSRYRAFQYYCNHCFSWCCQLWLSLCIVLPEPQRRSCAIWRFHFYFSIHFGMWTTQSKHDVTSGGEYGYHVHVTYVVILPLVFHGSISIICQGVSHMEAIGIKV